MSTVQNTAAEERPLSALIADYIQATEQEKAAAALDEIRSRPPKTDFDLRRLLDLYSRSDNSARDAVESSLALLTPETDAGFSAFFSALYEESDPIVRLFSVSGIAALKPPQTLDSLMREARKPFEIERPTFSTPPNPVYNWRIKMRVLELLAEWEGEKLLPLLEKRSEEAPDVAKLSSSSFWALQLPKLLSWSKSKRARDMARAEAGWSADPPRAELEKTRPQLWKFLESKNNPYALRHRAALKLGLCSADDDVERILERGKAAAAPKERLLWDAALFASLNPKAIPILTEYVRSHPQPEGRAGALTQLSGMLNAEAYAALLAEMAARDPDPGNRMKAQKTLQEQEELLK